MKKKKKNAWMDPETYTRDALEAAALKRRKSVRFDGYCRTGLLPKDHPKCGPKTMDKRVVTNARGDGAKPKGGKTRKQILGGELRRYDTEENDGKAKRATRVASYD